MKITKNKNVANTYDMLTAKQAKLEKLKSQADNAISLVTQTMKDLEYTNQEIDATVVEIDDYMTKLSATRDSLNKNRKHNAVIIANFAKLLDVNEEDA